jgi:hypothetical protein
MFHISNPHSSRVIQPIQEVHAPQLLDRICVRQPYFALSAMSFDGDVFTAKARAELPQGREVGPMRGAEVSRHGAIAGLCAAAVRQQDDKRRYYLAQEAVYVNKLHRGTYGQWVDFSARVVNLDKRSASSVVTAMLDGEPVGELTVNYTILSEAAFERLFQNRRREQDSASFLQRALGGTVTRDDQAIQRVVAAIPVEVCAGHFEGYPALPVALLIDQLAELGGELLGGSYLGVRAEVHANDLCWAGEAATFRMALVQERDRVVTFRGTVLAGTRSVCEATIQLYRC